MPWGLRKLLWNRRVPALPYLPRPLRIALVAHCAEKSKRDLLIPELIVSTVGFVGGVWLGAWVQARSPWPGNALVFAVVLVACVLASNVICGVLVARVIRPHMVEYLQDLNRCVDCGYDVSATPDRCPECGLVPRAAERAVAIRRRDYGIDESGSPP